MSAYQKLKEFQDEVEKLTGFRPHVSVNIYDHYYPGVTDREANMARNLLVMDSGNELVANDQPIENGLNGTYMNYQASSKSGIGHIEFTFHGPKKGKTE